MVTLRVSNVRRDVIIKHNRGVSPLRYDAKGQQPFLLDDANP